MNEVKEFLQKELRAIKMLDTMGEQTFRLNSAARILRTTIKMIDDLKKGGETNDNSI